MAKRSLKASQEGIIRAKRAFDLRGWTQEYLAAEVGLQTRQSVWKFFSGRPVERHIFIDICFTLDLDWEDIVNRAAFVADTPELPASAESAGNVPAAQNGVEELVAARSHLVTLAQSQCQLLELPLDLHHPLTLAQLYTDAFVRPYQRLGQSASVAKTPAVEAIQNHSRVLVLGGPGAGKTTLLQHLALAMGEHCLQDDDQTYLPVFLRLRQLALVSDPPLDLRQYLDQRWLVSGLSQTQINYLWQRGHLWLLLDGWDELPAERHRLVTQQIQALLDTHPGLRVLISGRSGGPMPQLNGLVTLELTEFAPQQVETFVHKWFTASQPDRGDALTQTFLQTLNHPDNDRLREMALTPILLHLMCLVFHRFGQFPEQRSKLYQQALDLLMGQWDQQRGIDRTLPLQRWSNLDLIGILCEVASRSFGQERLVLEAAELLGLIAKSLVNRGARNETLERLWADGKAILQALIEHYGMLTERELGSYAFAHLSFQEYLTARSWAITALERPHPEDWHDLVCQLGDPRWQEVIVLTVEMVPDPTPLWEALWQQSQRYVSGHPELAALLDWAQCRAEAISNDYHPAALRGFYLGLRMEQGVDLATAIDGRLAVDLPPRLALDQALIHLLHQARHWLDEPALQSGFDLALAMDLGQRFALEDGFAHTLYQLQTQLLTALKPESDLVDWCGAQGATWLQTLQQAVTIHCQWDGVWNSGSSPCLQTYYQMQRLLVNCLHHNRLFTAQALHTFERALLVREVQYEPA
jgi:predicted NACHT family NTPase